MSRIVGTLFALPFAAVGLFALGWAGHMFWLAGDMAGWQRVDATVLNGGYRTNRGDDSDTYLAWGEYTYVFAGREYRSRRVAMSNTSDNIGSFQRDLGERLAAAAAGGQTVDAWVNPNDPADAVIERRLRWGFQIFKLIFGLVFAAVGAGVLWAVWRSPAPAAGEPVPLESSSPWLANPDWQGEPIRSEARNAMRAAWLFAGLWNLVSLPLPFVIVDEVTEKQNYLALIGLLFPVIGVGLLVWAVRASREWWRFGPAPVELDPFPGSIGGHVGGRIRLRTRLDATQRVEVTLTLIRSEDGSDSRRESALWQEQRQVRPTTSTDGSQIEFQFDVPESLAASDAISNRGDYNVWRLSVRTALPGPDLDRTYAIPVYPTGSASSHIETRDTRHAREDQMAQDDAAIEALFDVRRGQLYPEIVFPMGRNLGFAAVGVVFGCIFAGAGYFVFTRADAPIMGCVFGLAGGLILAFSLYGATNSLTVSRDGAAVTARRFWLGIPLGSKQIDLLRIRHARVDRTMSSSSGTKHVVYYSVYLVDESGAEICVGEGLRGVNGAEAMLRRLQRELGLPKLPIEHKRRPSPRERAAARRPVDSG